MKKRRIKPIFVSLFMILCVISLVYSFYNIFIWKENLDKNDKIKKELEESITVIDEEYEIDFDSLKKQNSDAVAYLKVNNTSIDYVVVKGNDNSYYLNHNFDKKYNIAGWIFADYRNNFDKNDKNIIIYGHNIKDGSMFGTLTNVLEKDWQENEDNLQVILETENESALYQVFSTYIAEPNADYIKTDFNNDKEFSDFLENIKSKSNYDYNVDLNSNDSILTLSTCTATGSKRVVLHAKKII